MIPRPDFAAHRARLLARLEDDEAVLIFGAPVRLRNSDTEHRYRPGSDLWWLTGWPDPECVTFLRPGETPFVMFVQPRDPDMETWTGRRAGPEGARERFGADAAFSIDELNKELPRLLQGVSRLHYAIGEDPANDRVVFDAIRRNTKAARRNGLDVPETFHRPARLLHELRLIKGADELAVMRAAGKITAAAHTDLMRLGRPGTNERELDAALLHAFRKHGGDGPGYTNIVAAGDNATILHYVENHDTIEDGELVLIDAGCELQFYTADVTRTWPANGRFTKAQRDVYAHVLAAQHASIAAARAGGSWSDVHDASVRRLTEGMFDLGLLTGSFDEAIEKETFKKYYMHGTSHWLGIDVHDVGAYGRGGQSRVLAAGMVLTVEPGLYIPIDDASAPAALRGIGVRIEDDIHVTDGDPEVLTADCVKEIDDVEAVCAR